MELADQVVVMSMGRIEQIGTPREIRSRPGDPVRRRIHRHGDGFELYRSREQAHAERRGRADCPAWYPLRLERRVPAMATRGFTGRRPPADIAGRVPPGQSLDRGLPGALGRPDAARRARGLVASRCKVGPRPVKSWSWAEFNALPQTERDARHPLRHQLVASSTPAGGRAHRRPPGRRRLRAADRLHAGAFLRRLLDQRAGRRPGRRQGDGGAALRRRAARARPWRAGAAAGAAPLFLEVGEVGQRPAVHRARRAGLLGAARLPHLRRSVARAALHRSTEVRSAAAAAALAARRRSTDVRARRRGSRASSAPRRVPFASAPASMSTCA